jgi:serine/threonine-protein kinase
MRLGAEISWRSVHERVAAERDQLRESAMLDPLMGVLSRAALEQQLAVEMSRCSRSNEPLTVAILDVNGLRHINERHGHVAGDAALKHVAETARRLVRGQDVVARYGGDEIAILLGGTAVASATILLDRVCKAIEQDPLDTGSGSAVKISVTAGATEYKGGADDGPGLLTRAATAARAAKGHGDTIVLGDAASTDTKARAETELGPADRFEAGVTLGGMYQIVHEISRGAMGVVYRAEDLGLSRPVALKMLRPDLVRDKKLVASFRDEAAVLAALRHENLVQVYAFGEDGADVYFVMELVEGLSLEAVMNEGAERGDWPDSVKIASIVSEIGGALDAMHDAGLLHRDVKPGNVVLDRARDRAVLLDVGLAMPVGAVSDVAGTPGYMAPETVRGEEPTPASDVYGLAATAYALLLQRPPFGEADDYEVILRRQLAGPPKAPSKIRRELPATIDALFDRALSVGPRGRYRTPGEFAEALTEKLAARPSDATAAWPARRSATKVRKRSSGEKRTLTLSLNTIQPAETRLSRGILFRSAARVLGMSNAVAWLSGVARKNRPLADAMSPKTSALGWLPADLFVQLLHEVNASGRNEETFARELAKLALVETFRRFYPSEPTSLTPQSTLSAIDILWSRYHSWGKIKCDSIRETSATIAFSEGPPDVGVCAFTSGLLAKAVELSGGLDTSVEHPSCIACGDPTCRFDVTWRHTT